MVALMSLVLSSCGLFKKTTHTDTAIKAKASDSSSVSIRKVDSSATSKTTIKEKVDTTFTIPGSSQEGSKALDDIKRGDSLVLDDEDQRTVIEYDSETQRLRARSRVKDRKERVLIDRETTNESSTDIKRQAEDATHVAKSEVDATQVKDTSVKVKAGPDWSMWVTIWIVMGAAVLSLIIFARSNWLIALARKLFG